MTAILVDSNIIIDLFSENANWLDWSRDQLRAAQALGRLVINPVIYAEISARFSDVDELDRSIPEAVFEREPIPWPAAFLAGKAYLAYRRRGGTRRSPLPDFFIGAHAAVAGYALLTRDAARYRSYFPRLKLIAPGLAPD